MRYPAYALMYYDTSIRNSSWKLLYKHFILEENNDDCIKGIFLSDLWFNYKLHEKSDDIYFMILYIENEKSYNDIINVLNRCKNKNENNLPNILKMCIQTSFVKSFILTSEKIKELQDEMIEKDVNTRSVTLFQDSCLFSLDVMKHCDFFTISIPKFESKNRK